MKFEETILKGSYLIKLDPICDSRGFFSRVFCKKEFKEINLNYDWVNINNSISNNKGTLRGLHFQIKPKEEVKLVRCIRGSIWDVMVDLRIESPTFSKYYSSILSASNRNMLYIPKGFAHGFITLEDNSEIIYFNSQFYSPNHERTLLWKDKEVNVNWPIVPTCISEKDENGLSLQSIKKLQRK